MTVAASVEGLAISIPIGLGAARTRAPLPVYRPCRGMVAISRALLQIIVAILRIIIGIAMALEYLSGIIPARVQQCPPSTGTAPPSGGGACGAKA